MYVLPALLAIIAWTNHDTQDVIPQSNNFMKNFRDLLKKIFVYDPNQRITAKEALKHDWFKEMAYNDDGTEAAKIRLEKMMRAGQGVQYT